MGWRKEVETILGALPLSMYFSCCQIKRCSARMHSRFCEPTTLCFTHPIQEGKPLCLELLWIRNLLNSDN